MSEKQPPKRIWLNWYGDSIENGPPKHLEDVTWCEDKIEDCDVEYVAASEIAALKAELDEKTQSAIRITEWGNKMERQRNELLKQVRYMKNEISECIESPESLPRPDQPGYWWKIDGGKLKIGKAEIIQWEYNDGEDVEHVLAWSCGGVWTRCDTINNPIDTGSRWVKAVEPFISIHKKGSL